MADMLNQLVLGRSAIRRLMQRFAVRAILHFPRSRRMAAKRLCGIAISYPRRRRADDPRDEIKHCSATQPATVLVRPDGYIAWAARRSQTAVELAEVLTPVVLGEMGLVYATHTRGTRCGTWVPRLTGGCREPGVIADNCARH
ncbi:MAG: hypothetical protein K2X97_06325 [Mycobacteriaceae bacterium]|nr:hypothetical protein [Mycobacteriaceae bacterium]